MKLCSDRNYGCRYMAFKLAGKSAPIIENEKIRVLIIPGNGCDIADIQYKPTDTSFLWRTPLGMNSLTQPSNALNDPFNQTYHGGWFEAFPNVGLECNYNGISFQSYDEVKYLEWDYDIILDRPEQLKISFKVNTLKTPFLVEKTITLKSDETTFLIEETITNQGKEPVPFQWGHHPLLGQPFLSEECVIDFSGADIDTFFAFENARIEKGTRGNWPYINGKTGIVDLRIFPEKDADINDLYWLSNLKSNWMAVRNTQKNIGIGFAWDPAMFNHCLIWINANGDKGYPHYGHAYTLCIMPSTSGTHTILAEAEEKTIRKLEAGQSASTWICTSIFVPNRQQVASIHKNGAINLI